MTYLVVGTMSAFGESDKAIQARVVNQKNRGDQLGVPIFLVEVDGRLRCLQFRGNVACMFSVTTEPKGERCFVAHPHPHFEQLCALRWRPLGRQSIWALIMDGRDDVAGTNKDRWQPAYHKISQS